MTVRIENREDPDLGLHCFSGPFEEATSVQKFQNQQIRQQ